MRLPPTLLLLTALGCGVATSAESGDDETVASAADELKVPAALTASEFTLGLDKPSIRALQTWVEVEAVQTTKLGRVASRQRSWVG